MTKRLTYTGIGSRQTPIDVMHTMRNIAHELSANLWTLRSGGAQGADSAFEDGCIAANGNKEIYLPWNGFQDKYYDSHKGYIGGNKHAEAMLLAEKFIPHWHACSDGARKLHSRNTYQVLGANLDAPTDLLVCWTPDALTKGGTATAIKIALHYKIPVVNLAAVNSLDYLTEIVYKLEDTP